MESCESVCDDTDKPINTIPWSRATDHGITNPFKIFKQKSGPLAANPLKPCSHSLKKEVPKASKFFTGESSKDIDQFSIKLHSSVSVPLKFESDPQANVHESKDLLNIDEMLERISPYAYEITPEIIKNLKIMPTIELPTNEDASKIRINLSTSVIKQNKIELVLDLDETLVHIIRNSAEIFSPKVNSRIKTLELAKNGFILKVKYLKRPHLRHFLEKISPLYDISVFLMCATLFLMNLLGVYSKRRALCKSNSGLHRSKSHAHKAHNFSGLLHFKRRIFFQRP